MPKAATCISDHDAANTKLKSLSAKKL